jgi:hypothetical protein
MNEQNLKVMKNPVDRQDGVNKRYLDSLLDSIGLFNVNGN